MKKLLLLLFPLSLLVLQSCEKDFGTVEVTYTKATAVYGELDAVRNTPLIGTAQPIVNPGKIFVAHNLLLVGEEGEGIHVVDNIDPSNPINLSFINIPGNREYFVKDNTLYAESHYDMLKIDVTDKNRPTIVSRVNNAFADSEKFKNENGETLIRFDFEEVTEKVNEGSEIYQQIWNHHNFLYFDYSSQLIPPSQVPVSFAGNSGASVGSVNRIAVANNFVYVISRDYITPFEDNGTLTKLDQVFGANNMETIYPNEGNLFIGTAQSMEVFDISNPAQPRQSATFSHARSCDPVLPCQDVAFVTLRTGEVGNCPGDINALLVVDMKNGFPEQIQEIEMKSPFGMTMANGKLYVGEGKNGLKVFDATDKRNLELETWEKDIEAYDIIHHPTNANLLLIAGPTGISQYEVEGIDYSLLSTITF